MPVLRFIEPCLPSPADRPPSGSNSIHEIKHDGYRLMARRDSVGIRLITRRGNDWSDRFPLVVEAVNHLKVRSCLIDGEVCCCDERGLARFDVLRRRRNEATAFLYALTSSGPGAVIALTATTLPCAVQPMMQLCVGVVGLSSGRDRQALLMAQHDQLSPVANWRGFCLGGRLQPSVCRPVDAAGLLVVFAELATKLGEDPVPAGKPTPPP